MIRRFDKLSKAELLQLKRNNPKKARIIVHPFFLSPGNKNFERFIRNKGHEKSLTIISEISSAIPDLRRKLALLGVENSNNLFILSTKTKKISGMPYTSPDPTTGWQRLIGRLKHVGIKDVTVDGQIVSNTKIKDEKRFVAERLGKKFFSGKEDLIAQRRTQIRAAENVRTASARGSCAGFTYSKIAASGIFGKVRLKRKFK